MSVFFVFVFALEIHFVNFANYSLIPIEIQVTCYIGLLTADLKYFLYNYCVNQGCQTDGTPGAVLLHASCYSCDDKIE